MMEEMGKSYIDLLREELSLRTNMTKDKLEHADALTRETNKISSHFKKEAEKCNIEVRFCEDTREDAEAEFLAERKRSALWEKRARKLGWKASRSLS